MNKKKAKTGQGLESLGALVFSTSGENPKQSEPLESEFEQLAPSTFDLRVSLSKKQRAGKPVTLVTGFGDLHLDDLKDLAKMLKSKCGVGGSAKDGEIIVQGDHVVKVMELLQKEGFKVKRSGG